MLVNGVRREGPVGRGGGLHGGPPPRPALAPAGLGPPGPFSAPGAAAVRRRAGARAGRCLLRLARASGAGGPKLRARARVVAPACDYGTVCASPAGPSRPLHTAGGRRSRAPGRLGPAPWFPAVSGSSFTAGPGGSACNYAGPRAGTQRPVRLRPRRGGAWGGESRGPPLLPPAPRAAEARPSARTVNTSRAPPRGLASAPPAPLPRSRPRRRPSPAAADVQRASPRGRSPLAQGGASRALGSPGRTPGRGPPAWPRRDPPAPPPAAPSAAAPRARAPAGPRGVARRGHEVRAAGRRTPPPGGAALPRAPC